ncbi:MAG: hypothetical protein ACU84J_01315 [Gammaproteobacteria bacterium]
MKHFITIRLLGFNDSDRSKFESLLTIAENMLDVPWRLTDAVEADFYLLKGKLKSQMNQDHLLKTLPSQRCIFYTEQKTNGPYHEILVDKNNTPYLRSIIELFKSLTINKSSLTADKDVSKATVSHPSDSSPVASQQSVREHAVESDRFDPEEGLLGLLLNNRDFIKAYDLDKAGYITRLYVDPVNKHYYYKDDLEKLEFFFAQAITPLQDVLSEQQLQLAVANQNLRPLPLSNLLWYGAFVSSKGRLLKGHRIDEIVHLKRWPDISLPGSRKLIKLAAFMQSNAVDLSTIRQQTGIGEDQVYNFFNACKVIDLIEYSQKAEMHEKNLDDNQRQLFAKIGKRLTQTENGQ